MSRYPFSAPFLAPVLLLSALSGLVACDQGSGTFVDESASLPPQFDPAVFELVPENGFQTDSNPNSPAPGQALPAAPQLQVSPGPGRLLFSWDWQDPDYRVRLIQSNPLTREYLALFATRGDLVSSWSYAIRTPVFNWVDTRFMLELCNSDHCLYSQAVAAAPLRAALLDRIEFPGAAAGEQIGSALDLSADASTLISGAPGAVHQDQADAGAVVVQFRIKDRWWPQTRLYAATAFAGARLGHSVAVSADGNTVVAGAPGDPTAAAGSAADYQGAAYVFERFGEGWAQTTQLPVDEPALSALGETVQISADGNTIAVAAPGTQIDGHGAAGAVWIYQRISSQWRLIQTLSAAVPAAGARFGSALALSGDAGTLFISDHSQQGAVAVYSLLNNQYRLSATLRHPAAATRQFAAELSIDASASLLIASLVSAAEPPEPAASLRLALYQREADGSWTLGQLLNPRASWREGQQLALANSDDAEVITLAVHTPGERHGRITSFVRESAAAGDYWQYACGLGNPATQANGFAAALALPPNGQRMLIGAPQLDSVLDDGTRASTGGVYYY